jgi:Bifunctional DNA primase/polymerase, N-terminal
MHPAITLRDQHRQDGKLRNPAWPPLLDAALHYATLNLPVFPCVPRGKNPAVARGFYSATTNPETIRRFWSVRDRNVAIPTGAISGFWVLDIDPDHCGDASIDALQAKHGMLPPTREVITGGGGRHLWFRYTGPIQSSEGRVAPGIDVRGDGGYVVAPPSIHQNGRAYAWVAPDCAEPAIAPGWLVALTRKGAPSISERGVASLQAPRSPSGAYGEAGAQWRDRGAQRGRGGGTQRCSEPRHLSALSARRRRRAQSPRR